MRLFSILMLFLLTSCGMRGPLSLPPPTSSIPAAAPTKAADDNKEAR